MEHMPHVCPIEPSELLDFCTESGYTYRLESQGSLLIPPDYNVGMTDWERSMRLRYAATRPHSLQHGRCLKLHSETNVINRLFAGFW